MAAVKNFSGTQIREVRRQRPESRWDGVLIGLGIGAVAGVLNVKSTCSGASEREDCLAVGWGIILPLFAGGGAGVGALMDFASKKHDIVFARATTSNYRFRLSPTLGKQQKGVILSVSF